MLLESAFRWLFCLKFSLKLITFSKSYATKQKWVFFFWILCTERQKCSHYYINNNLKCCSMYICVYSLRSMQAWRSANALMPRQFDGWSWLRRNSQQASCTSNNCRTLAAGSRFWHIIHQRIHCANIQSGAEKSGPPCSLWTSSSSSYPVLVFMVLRLSRTLG